MEVSSKRLWFKTWWIFGVSHEISVCEKHAFQIYVLSIGKRWLLTIGHKVYND